MGAEIWNKKHISNKLYIEQKYKWWSLVKQEEKINNYNTNNNQEEKKRNEGKKNDEYSLNLNWTKGLINSSIKSIRRLKFFN